MASNEAAPPGGGTPKRGLTQTHEVTMRQAVGRVARAIVIVTVFVFDLAAALAILVTVFIAVGTP